MAVVAVKKVGGRQRPLLVGVAAWMPLLLLLLAALVLQGAAAAKSGKSGWQKVYKAMEKAPYNILAVDDQQFHDMMVEPGRRRDFPVVALFTAAAPKYGCTPCHALGQLLVDAAMSYTLRNARRPADQQLPPVAFMVVDVDQAPRTFHELFKFETVPHTLVFPANQAINFPPQEDEYSAYLDMEEGAAAVLGLLKDRAGVELELIPDAGVTVQVAGLLAAVVALAVYLVLDQWEWTAALPYNRWLWLSGSYLIFTTAVGGMVYCVIRSPPPFGMQQQRLHLFAMHTSQDQFVAEGLIMGAINLFAGLSLVSAYVFASKARYRIVQFVGLNVSLALAAYFLMQLFSLYSQKTRWYQLGETLDPNVSTFFFQPIKRTSGWGKRLWRVTQIWVNEFKDWPSFSTIATAMFVNHGKRQLASYGIGSGA